MAGLPPSARLRRAADFAALRGARGRIQTQHFLLRFGPSHTAARLGLAVSRKVSKRAVIRNRIKRVTRESFRACRLQLPCCDVLVIAHAAASTATPAVLRSDLDAAWQRLQTLKLPPHPVTIGG